MADYPNNPTVGQQYTVNNKTFQWDGEKWKNFPSLEAVPNGVVSYATSADLESSTPLVTGQRAENRERANAQYELAASGYTAKPGDIVAANGRVWRHIVNGPVNAREFGLFGGDATSILQSIADWMDESKEVYFLDDFSLTDAVTFSNGGKLDFGNITVDCTGIPAGTTGNSAYGLIFKGEALAASAISSNIQKGQSSFTASTSLGLSAGDLVFIGSDQTFVDGYGNAFNKRGEVLKVKSASGSSFTTFDGAYFEYDSAENIVVQRIASKGYEVSGGNFKFAGDGSVISGMKFEYQESPQVSNVVIDGAEDCGIQTWYCYGGKISGCTLSNITSPGEGSSGVTYNSGYGIVAFSGTRGLLVENNKFLNCRRGVTGGGAYPSIYVKTLKNYVSGGFNGLGTHEPCLSWEVSSNIIEGLSGVGLNIRGQDLTANDNVIKYCAAGGVRVRNFGSGGVGITGVNMSNNKIDDCGGNGYWFEGDETGGRVREVNITGGHVRNVSFNAVFGTRCDDVMVAGVNTGAINPGTESSTDGNAVFFRGSTALDDQCTNITVEDITIEETTLRHGVSFRYGVDVSATNIKMLNPSPSHGINGLSCEGISIEGGKVKAPSTATSFLYPTYLQDCNKVKVEGVDLYGFAGTANIHGVRIQSSTISEDHVVTGCSMYDCDRAVSIVSAGTNHSVVIGNNGRNCTNAQKFDVDSANQVLANNLE